MTTGEVVYNVVPIHLEMHGAKDVGRSLCRRMRRARMIGTTEETSRWALIFPPCTFRSNGMRIPSGDDGWTATGPRSWSSYVPCSRPMEGPKERGNRESRTKEA